MNNPPYPTKRWCGIVQNKSQTDQVDPPFEQGMNNVEQSQNRMFKREPRNKSAWLLLIIIVFFVTKLKLTTFNFNTYYYYYIFSLNFTTFCIILNECHLLSPGLVAEIKSQEIKTFYIYDNKLTSHSLLVDYVITTLMWSIWLLFFLLQ